MSLVIMIPTYQRPDALLWSLRSVLEQKIGDIGVCKKLFILNNDKSSKDAVDKTVSTALAQVSNHEFDLVETVQGNTEIPAVKNIYGHFKEFTAEGDIAIIHGDDDIMFPDTLLHRYHGAVASAQFVCLAKFTGSCFFFKNKAGVFLDTVPDPYQPGKEEVYRRAAKEDITGFPLPFISVYIYKTGKTFWSIYDEAISWSDRLPFEPKIKYPFVPFFIGLSAYYRNELSVCDQTNVIRGQLFATRKLLPPLTVTEYANGGIISLTGLAILNNKELKTHPDYNLIRKNFRDSSKNYVLQALSRRDGVSLGKLRTLYQLADTQFSIGEFSFKTVLQNLRNLADNLLFTRNIKRWLTGWGKETSPVVFWENWTKNNYSGAANKWEKR